MSASLSILSDKLKEEFIDKNNNKFDKLIQIHK